MLDLIANKKTGGYQHLPAGFIGPPIERPAIALLLRPDGSVAVHNEADDVVNEVRRDIDANYKQEIKESGKKRESSTAGDDGNGRDDGWNGRHARRRHGRWNALTPNDLRLPILAFLIKNPRSHRGFFFSEGAALARLFQEMCCEGITSCNDRDRKCRN